MSEFDDDMLFKLAVEMERKKAEEKEKKRLRYLKTLETRREKKKTREENNPIQTANEKIKTRGKARERRDFIRKTVFDHYGNKCVCCGETIEVFLTVDHIYNGGAEHRKEVGSGIRLYKWLIDNDFPDGFQLLCRNCNWGKHVNNGICPHKA